MSAQRVEPFGDLLREKIAELDADEAHHVALEGDPVERLRLDARQVVMTEHHGQMARSGHQAYVVPSAPPCEQPRQRHLNIVR